MGEGLTWGPGRQVLKTPGPEKQSQRSERLGFRVYGLEPLGTQKVSKLLARNLKRQPQQQVFYKIAGPDKAFLKTKNMQNNNLYGLPFWEGWGYYFAYFWGPG